MTRIAQLDLADYALAPGLVDRIVTPALVVHLDMVRSNIRKVIQLVGGDATRWRPHVKTVKIPEVLAELPRAGVLGFKCATTREAEVLARVLHGENVAGGDVLLAHAVAGPGLGRLGQIARTYPSTRFSVLRETPELVDALPAELDVFVDVNPGMHRTGTPVDRQELILQVARRAADRFRGIHFYDGHLLDADEGARRRQAFEGYDALVRLVLFLRKSGVRVPEIVTSGTPSFLYALEYRGFEGLEGVDGMDGTTHRVSPGTVVYHDARSAEECPALDLKPAAVLFTRVVSRPHDEIATCDAGAKSIAAEAGDPCAHVIGHPEYVARSPSEEHLPLAVPAGTAPQRGTELFLVPRHVCPTVNLAEQAILVEDGKPSVVVDVAARAHDLWVNPSP